VEDRCVVCQKMREDGAHLFFKCKDVKAIWRIMGLEVIKGVLASMTSPMQVLQKILQLEESSKIHTIVLLWTWWSERNKIREGERQDRRKLMKLRSMLLRF
jgi:hypothetical protein